MCRLPLSWFSQHQVIFFLITPQDRLQLRLKHWFSDHHTLNRSSFFFLEHLWVAVFCRDTLDSCVAVLVRLLHYYNPPHMSKLHDNLHLANDSLFSFCSSSLLSASWRPSGRYFDGCVPGEQEVTQTPC